MYSTAKKVKFYAPFTVFAKYALMVLVLAYVLGYQFLYKGIHLKSDPVKGTLDYRMRPATAPCSKVGSWRPACGRLRSLFTDLSYCKVNKGPATLDKKLKCKINKQQGVNLWPMRLYIPTWVQTWTRPLNETFMERLLSKPDELVGTNYTGDSSKDHQLWQEPEAKLKSEDFVAMVEEQMFEIEQRIQLPYNRNITGLGMDGYFLPEGENSKPMRMVLHHEEDFRHLATNDFHSKDRGGSSFLMPAPKEGHGDASMLKKSKIKLSGGSHPVAVADDFDALVKISLAGILELAGVDLDHRATETETWRSCGVKILLEIRYQNTAMWPGFHVTPWTEPKPWFTWHVRREEATCTSKFNYHGSGRDFIRTRGIDLELVQTGTLRAWSPFCAIVGVTTILTLVGAAMGGLDFYLEHCTSWFKGYKYDEAGRPDQTTPDEETGASSEQQPQDELEHKQQ